MTNESPSSRPLEGSSPTPRARLDRAARLRAEAAQAIAAAEKIEADEARVQKEDARRDHRILGEVVMGLAKDDPDLARVLVRGVESSSVSKFDQNHLRREGSALMRLRKIVEAPPSDPTDRIEPDATEAGAWFAVPFTEKDRVPKGVIYDPTTKARFAPTEALVVEMRRLGFDERLDLGCRLPQPRP